MKELQKINQDYEIELPQETRQILKTIFEEGTAENTAKAQARDIKKFWQWTNVRFGIEESYPVPVGLIINYITDHLGGMSPEIDKKLVAMGVKSRLGAHKLSTIKRRLYSLSAYHNLKGLKPNPCRDKAVLAVISKAHRALVQNGVVVDKKEAATIEIMERLVATCGNSSKDVRDKALLLVGFSSGGRRRSEIVRMKVEDLRIIEDGYTIKMNFSKGDYAGVGKEFPIKGLAAEALKDWLDKSGVTSGPLFRSIDRYGNVGDGLKNARAANFIFKNRAKLAGLDLKKFSAHSLRSGFITSAIVKGKSPYDIIQLTNHKSVQSVNTYFREAAVQVNPAADLM